VGKPRCSSIARTPLPACTYANTLSLPPHLPQANTSKSNVLFSTSAQSTRGVLCFIRSLLAAASLPALASSAWGSALPLAASLGDHVISVSALSKAYGVPGIRVGWLITTNPRLREVFLAAKEQISICGSVLDEHVALTVLRNRQAILEPTLAEMRRRLEQVALWMQGEELLEWVRPAGGVVCFPRMRSEPAGGVEAFYERLLAQHGTYVGPGHWFEMPDTHFRLGYGWPTADQLTSGLAAISKALRG
jgi:aspartate/methionine/tyrosine aminotransferase